MFESIKFSAIATGIALVATLPVYAANTATMLSACKSRAANAYKTSPVDTPLPKGEWILGSQRLLALIKFLLSK